LARFTGHGLPMPASEWLKIINAFGQLVATLVNEQKEAGYHQATWNASNVPSGIYFYRLQAVEFVETKKMVLLK
jgi:flagellar hook assembly protein FlgD